MNRGNRTRTLIIGSSTGYGLSSRICETWLNGSDTIGVCFEKPTLNNRTATPGWYNTAAFEKYAKKDGLYAKTLIGDAFAKDTKKNTIEQIKRDLGKVDRVIYSLAAPRRQMPDGKIYTSSLKTIEKPFVNKGLKIDNDQLIEKIIELVLCQDLVQVKMRFSSS